MTETGTTPDRAAERVREIDGYWNRGYGGDVSRSFVDELLDYALALLDERERLLGDDTPIGVGRKPLTKRELSTIGLAVVKPSTAPPRWDHATVAKLYWAVRHYQGAAMRADARVEAARQREDTMRDAMLRDRAEVTKLRARLDEIGEVREEWASNVPGNFLTLPWFTEKDVRGIVEAVQKAGGPASVQKRFVSEWRDADKTRQACCQCGSDAVTYHNYRNQPFCAPCANGEVPNGAGREGGESGTEQDGKRSARTMTLVATFLRVTGLTHAEAGRLLGVSGNAVAAWERGARMNQAHRNRLDDLNGRAQLVPSKTFYGRRDGIFAARDGQPSIYDEWLAEGWTPPVDPDGEAAYFEAGEPEYRFVQPDGSVSEFDVHNGPCGCQRQVRRGNGPWLAAGGWVSAETAQALEPGPAPFTLPFREALEAGVQSHLRAPDSRTADNNSPSTISDTNPEEPAS